MSSSSGDHQTSLNKYKGIRRRKWGKWVSEIRVPGTPERLWLGSYATPEAAAVAHDVALYCLRGVSSPESLNFPLSLPAGAKVGLSPRSVQKAASDAGMAIDASFVESKNSESGKNVEQRWESTGSRDSSPDEYLNISVEDYMY